MESSSRGRAFLLSAPGGFPANKKNKKMKENKIEQLKEQYNVYCSNSDDGQGDGMSLAEYIRREASNDPFFWGWLFEDENLESPADLTEEQREEFESLLK